MKRSADQLQSAINIQDYILDYLYKENKNQQQNILALQVDINNFILARKLTKCTLNIEVLAQQGSKWKLKAISQALSHNNLIESLTLKYLFSLNPNKIRNNSSTEDDEDIAQHLSSMLRLNNDIKRLVLYDEYSNNLTIEQPITQGVQSNQTLRSLICSPDIEGGIPEYLSNHSSIKFLTLLDRIEKGVPEFISSSKKIISLNFRIKEFEEFNCDDQLNTCLDPLKVALQNNNNLQQLTLEINNPDLNYADIVNFFSEVLERNCTLERIILEGECSDVVLSSDINNKLLANMTFNNRTIELIYSLNFTLNINPTANHLEAIKRTKKMGNSLFEEKLKQHLQVDWNNVALIQRCGETYEINELKNYESVQDKERYTASQLNEFNYVLREYISIYENTQSAVSQKIQGLNNYYSYYSQYFHDESKNTDTDSICPLQKDLYGLDSFY